MRSTEATVAHERACLYYPIFSPLSTPFLFFVKSVSLRSASRLNRFCHPKFHLFSKKIFVFFDIFLSDSVVRFRINSSRYCVFLRNIVAETEAVSEKSKKFPPVGLYIKPTDGNFFSLPRPNWGDVCWHRKPPCLPPARLFYPTPNSGI